MNLEEGHLGGYIRGRQSAVSTVYRYEHGDPETWTPELWCWAYETLGVRSVIDVGCGEGHAARFFRELGCRVVGVDGSWQAQRDSVIGDQHVRHDYTQGLYLPGDEFDLVWSSEFVEHVEERYLGNFFATFDSGRRYLMMTFAFPGQPGHHHVNCQPAEYWLEKLARLGFDYDKARTEESRAVARKGHYRRAGLFFIRR